MDTKENIREEAAVRRPRKEAPKSTGKTPGRVQKGNPPSSAQQRNGAARTAEEQRTVAAKGTAAGNRDVDAPMKQRKPQSGSSPKKARPAEDAAARKEAERRKKLAAQKKKQAQRKAEREDVPNRKRAYGKTKPKKKSAIATVSDSLRDSAQKRKAKKTAAKASAGRPKQPAPAVIYTQPQPFNRNRLLIQLLTVLAVVVALVLGLSVFFKVDKITVSGADVYDAWTVREKSGISEGDNLLTFSHARAGAQIKANLPYVKTVRFGIKLPDTVNIIIEEEDVVYAVKSHDDTLWLMTSEGRIVEQAKPGSAANYTQIEGVRLDSPERNAKAVALESTPTETDATGGEVAVPVSVTGAQRLNAVLQILEALEENDIVGDAASVDVSRLEDIILWYGTRYQVNLGDSTRLDYKIACMNDVILQMSDYQSGILDISFTTWPDQVGYTPFA